jgi:COMPASS component SWD2
VTCRTDDTLQIFNCKLSQHAKELRSQKYGAHLARFTHHSSSILYASTKVNHDIRYLSTHDNSYLQYFKGHEGMVTCLTMSPADDGFMSCAEDDTLRLWTLNTQNSRGILKLQGAYLAAYDPTSSVIAAASHLTHELMLYDLRNFDKAPFSTFDLREYEGLYNRGVENPSWTKL